jgi:RNA polymerase sigma factor (sigma-70 family)
MPPDPSDWATGEHFERWKNGDERAFECLHARFAPLLRSRIRRHPAWSLLDGHFAIDDLLQDVWARAVAAAKQRFQYVGTGSLLAFLGQILDCEVTDQARRHGAQKRGANRVQTIHGDGDPRGLLPGHAAPETPTGQARASEILGIARTHLSPREYEAWDLVELQQFTADEAALALDCTAAAVRGLLLRGRARLIVRLADDRAAR